MTSAASQQSDHPNTRSVGASKTGALLLALMFAGLIGLSGLFGGCAVQLSGGVSTNNEVITTGARLSSQIVSFRRQLSGFLGGFIDFGDRDKGVPLTVNSGGFWVGARRLVDPRYTFEATLDIGIGEPGAVEYESAGMYVGTGLAGLIRISGLADRQPIFAVAAPMFDLGVTARFGYWSPPLHSVVQGEFEASFHLALRITLGSDLLAPSDLDVEYGQ